MSRRCLASSRRGSTARRPDPLDLRLAALIEMLYGSGLRASELVSLPLRAISTDRPYLILKGKGGRERLVPISDRARAAIAAWRGHVAEGSLWLFPSGASHLSRIRLFQLVRALAAEAGIDPARVSPHCAAPCLRHASAGRRCGPARAPGNARSCRHRDDADLHPCRRQPARRAGQCAPSPR